MNKTVIAIVLAAIVAVGYIIYTSKAQAPATPSKADVPFKSISSTTLSKMLENKDFTLIDVHTPEQEHIPGTDYVIPYTEISDIVSKIENKDSKVVLYCRSGGMSKRAAGQLAKMGYTNVYELESGVNEWRAEGRDLLPKGGITAE